MFGEDYGCDGNMYWTVWDMESSEWVWVNDGCVVHTKVSGYTKGDRNDAKNEPPSKGKGKNGKNGKK